MNLSRAAVLVVSLALAHGLSRHDGEGGDGAPGLVTLYAQDDLQSSFDFRSGSAGGRVSEGEVRLDGAQLAFDVFAAGRLSFGFTRDERVDVLDLGAATVAPRASARDRAEELDISIFHTLFRGDTGFFYVGPGNDVDPFERADRILSGVPPEGLRHVEPMVGHTYLLRVRRNGTSADEFFKFEVVGLLPGHSLTMRWAPF